MVRFVRLPVRLYALAIAVWLAGAVLLSMPEHRPTSVIAFLALIGGYGIAHHFWAPKPPPAPRDAAPPRWMDLLLMAVTAWIVGIAAFIFARTGSIMALGVAGLAPAFAWHARRRWVVAYHAFGSQEVRKPCAQCGAWNLTAARYCDQCAQPMAQPG